MSLDLISRIKARSSSMGCFIYILGSSNSSSITFWSGNHDICTLCQHNFTIDVQLGLKLYGLWQSTFLNRVQKHLRIYVVKTLSCTVFWCSCLCFIKRKTQVAGILSYMSVFPFPPNCSSQGLTVVHKLLVHSHRSESGMHSLPSRSSRCPRSKTN